MTLLRTTAMARQKAATICGLLAVVCWLILSLVPASAAAHRISSNDVDIVVVPADQCLGVEGLRTETLTAKSTIDDHDLPCLDWPSLDQLQATSVWKHAHPFHPSAAVPAESLLTLGICLRL